MKNIILSVFVIMNFTLSVLHAEDADFKSKRVSAILDLSGIHKQTLSIKDSIQEPMNQALSKNNLTEEQKNKLAKLMMEELQPDKTLKTIADRMEKEFSAEELETLYEFYNLPNTKVMSRLEEEVSTPNGQRSVVEYAKGFEKNPPAKERLNALLEFDKKSMTSEKSVLVVVNMVDAMVTAFNHKLSLTDKAKMMQEMRPSLIQTVVVTWLYAYKDISQKDLTDYFNAYTSNKALMKLSNLAIEEYDILFKDWGKRSAVRIMKEFKPASKK